MDGRGRVAQPMKRSKGRRARPAAEPRPAADLAAVTGRIRRVLRNWIAPLRGLRAPRGAGLACSAVLVLVAVGYGVVKGDHVPVIVAQFKDARDAVANAAGFAIHSVSLSGRKQLGERDILAAAGVNPRASLLFLDVEAARAQLKTNPWIADAEVRKLYPDRLSITIEEREPFALWQKDGKISVIAADGAVLAPFTGERRFSALPLRGRAGRAGEGQGVSRRAGGLPGHPRPVARLHPDRRAALEPAAEERHRCAPARNRRRRGRFEALAGLDRDKKLLSRDITAVDLRLPDRVTRAAFRCRRPGARGRAQEDEEAQGRRRVNALNARPRPPHEAAAGQAVGADLRARHRHQQDRLRSSRG